MSSIKSKLNRYKKHLKTDIEEKVQENVPDIEIPHVEKWDNINTIPFYFEKEYSLVREVTYPIDYKHGRHRFSELFTIEKMWNESSSKHPLSCKGHEVSELFFFDTETTGLGGGTGNMIFLLGQAQVFPDRVVVKQHFLPKPGNEVSLYQSFLKDINVKKLVTYNGKAFDWPQVKTRHTLLRGLIPTLPEFGHFDLLHASRRLWKNKLESVRLSLVEKEILQVERDGDIPGYLAPMMYYQFLEHKDPDIIAGVLKHNEIDVLSLITLYIHLTLKILKPEEYADETEHYEVARWLDSVGEREDAYMTYEKLLPKGNKNEAKTKLAMAVHLKRQKQWDKAVELWESVLKFGNYTLKCEAGIELAKYYEHQKRDYDKALHYVSEVSKIIKEREQFLDFIGKEKEELTKRRERLERKLIKQRI
ncbi:ribonuclease H-like domain-containing protein [Metabacillus fastidiosus]|uniref:ribonuclease H-like domain-containing protein n=1 Tax=Metabacillus fastidiosus TaxID=1458 RepID=UPI003D291D89